MGGHAAMQNAMLVGVGLLALGETITPILPELGTLTNLGAVGVLAWVAFTQRQELRDLREKHANVIDTLCSRWDAWEQLRHSDSNRLDETLRQMVAHCAETVAQVRPKAP